MMRRLLLINLLLLGITLALADDSKLDTLFEDLDITPGMVDKLGSDDKAVVTATISEVLRKHLAKKDISLGISPEEARFSQNLANKCQDQTSCGCRVESRGVQVYAAIKRSSSFSTSNKLFEDAGIFLEAMLDAEVGAFGDIRGKFNIRYIRDIKLRKKRSPGWGKKFKKSFKKRGKRFKKSFKKVWKKVVKNPIKKINRELIERPIKNLKCARLVRKTVGFNLVSTGVVKIGIRLSVGNMSFTEADGGMLLSFVPNFDIVGQIDSWNLDQVKASKCVERLAGLKVLSYCGFLEKKARNEIEKNMKKIQTVKLPAVIEKLERKLKAKIGKAVSILIPLEFTG
eukprot:GFUD01036094.1.p1 GENE.GFUD01036094.1~~GFUD01036094.1.p1  ORF type:complete len:342 (-),score=101.48 GFUD01036094.1:60-1085(-)